MAEEAIRQEIQDMKEAHHAEIELAQSAAFLDLFRGTNRVLHPPPSSAMRINKGL